MRIAFQLGFRIRTAGQRPSITRGQSCSFSLEAWTSFRWFVLSLPPRLHSIKTNHGSIGFGSMEGSPVLCRVFLTTIGSRNEPFHQPKPVSIVWNRIFMLWNGIFYFYQERTQVREMFRHKRCFQQPWRHRGNNLGDNAFRKTVSTDRWHWFASIKEERFAPILIINLLFNV